MLTLYDAARCPYAARVRIVLGEKGVEYETVAVDLDDRPAWLYVKNPAGKVPVLEEDEGLLLPESLVIMEYLEERYPEPPLAPADAAERALARLRILRFEALAGPYYALRNGDEGARTTLARSLGELDGTLEAQPFLTGSGFGLADIAYVPWLIRARTNLGVSLEPYPALERWLERLGTRPSVAAELELVTTL